MELDKLQLCALLLVCVFFLHILAKAVGQTAALFFVTSYSLIWSVNAGQIGSYKLVLDTTVYSLLLVTGDTACYWLL
jgi:hypothetical protein